MSKTREELRNKAFAIAVGGDAGGAPSSDDAVAIDGYIDGVVARLQAKGALYLSDLDQIPDELFISLASLVANDGGDEFGKGIDPAKDQFFTREIREMARQMPGYGPQQVEYF